MGCNLAVPGCIVGKLPAKSQLPSRDCHVASLLAMTHQGGAAVHQCPCAVECPCTRRSLTAATDAIGAHRFNVTRYELQLPPRDRHVREARVASALSPYNILSKKSKIAINPDFSVPISPFRLLSQKKSVMMEGRICNCIFHGRFCRCPAFFRCITQPRPVKTNEKQGTRAFARQTVKKTAKPKASEGRNV